MDICALCAADRAAAHRLGADLDFGQAIAIFGNPFPLIPFLAELPAASKKEYHEALEGAHELLANGLLIVVAAHVAAALRHAIVLKDGVFSRMQPRLGRDAEASAALPAKNR